MNPSNEKFLMELEVGGVLTHKNMSVYPLSCPHNGGPDYLTLKEALERGLFQVTEVSEGGQVPNLKVMNKAEIPVLLIDGEELAGAKQNRVLNTTILVKEKTEVIIPVSCTEHGRWSYESRAFSESGNIMSASLRMINKRGISANLEAEGEFRSNQGEVWDAIAHEANKAGAKSRTGAMKDTFESRKNELDDYLAAFVCGAGQLGMLVVINGAVVGFDVVSKAGAFGALYPKLLKSYAMEAILENGKKKGGNGGAEKEAGKEEEKGAEKARAFLKEAAGCDEKSYESAGMGSDFRYVGKKIIGSALAVEGHIVHMAFFRAGEAEIAGNMAGVSRRRGFRI